MSRGWGTEVSACVPQASDSPPWQQEDAPGTSVVEASNMEAAVCKGTSFQGRALQAFWREENTFTTTAAYLCAIHVTTGFPLSDLLLAGHETQLLDKQDKQWFTLIWGDLQLKHNFIYQ